jgi:hypothetical protein
MQLMHQFKGDTEWITWHVTCYHVIIPTFRKPHRAVAFGSGVWLAFLIQEADELSSVSSKSVPDYLLSQGQCHRHTTAYSQK